MCGIVGVAAKERVVDREWVTAGRDVLRHRGPDDAGEWWSEDGRAGLGFRRLAIIDLTPAGHQPMQDVDGQCCIVFNGEIYNFLDLRNDLLSRGHRFVSNSDTEVILAAYKEWGTDCLSRLNGMFAFALYDIRRHKLFIARDRAGEKPLFYTVSKGVLRFASELKALMSDPGFPRRINRDALDCFLAMGFVPGDRCLLDGVHKLPSAHALLFDVDDGKCIVWRYWRAPDPESSTVSSEGELLDELDGLLEDAVRRQSHADVPVGILLSGGVDSSLIAAMAARSSSHVRTFTIRFPDEPRLDETEHARLIANHFGTDHTEFDAEPRTIELLPILARQFDEPIADSSMIPTYLVSELIRKHCTVALAGDGGDELFGGYHHYNRLLWAQRQAARVPRRVRMAVSGTASSVLPVGFYGRVWLQAFGTDMRRGLPLIGSFFDDDARRHLLEPVTTPTYAADKIRRERIPQFTDMLQRATRMDFENYLVEDILVKVDRASMLNSLELRAPLLDYRIIEFAFRKVPSPLKATASSRKILLKKLAARLLPAGFDMKRKQGFSIPLGSWLQSAAWREFFNEVLLGSDATLFNRKAVGALMSTDDRRRANAERLFALLMFELWRREYAVTL
jgi:asparagine synthase (glutamine-hydrolysing)